MKRKRTGSGPSATDKRIRLDSPHVNQTVNLLRHYYTNVCTLRQYLLGRLPETAKRRKRQLLNHGLSKATTSADDQTLEVRLLDRTLIGSHKYVPLIELEAIDKDILIFSQQLSGSTFRSSSTQQSLQQADIIDFCIWKVQRTASDANQSAHVLCNGLQSYDADPARAPNPQHQRTLSMKRHPWTILPRLLGSNADRVLCEMFIQCGVFIPAGASSNMIQISGQSLSELRVVTRQDVKRQDEEVRGEPGSIPYCRLSDIRILRQRMLYGRPDRAAGGKLRYSLGHAHILNRLASVTDLDQTIHLAKYIFPHQFKLRSVFTAADAQGAAAEALRTYGDRDFEIAEALLKKPRKLAHKIDQAARLRSTVPRRLRGEIMKLVQRIRVRYNRAAFRLMLERYCPRSTYNSMSESISLATSDNHVSAFCRAAVFDVFGAECMGQSAHNLKSIQAKIDQFVRLRRYEQVSMHGLLDGIRIGDVKWLAVPGSPAGSRMSRTDFDKRKELLAEMLYFVFDSFLIPLIKGHFYVTESSAHRNRLFYFRHDTWVDMCALAMRDLKANMLEECSARMVKSVVTRRSASVNNLRMVPKEAGMRPIINLRRRSTKQQGGRTAYTKSINSLLQPAFHAMNFERQIRPDLVGHAMFSIDDILPQIETYRKSLVVQNLAAQPLYFAKIDVRSCFDSLPQDELLRLAAKVLERQEYAIKKFSRAKLLGGRNAHTPGFGAKPRLKFLSKACERERQLNLEEIIDAEVAKEGRTNSIYTDGRGQAPQSRAAMLNTLRDHIQCNLVQVGNRIYRQKQGIAQGSIVSSLLCNLLYTQMERDVLAFTHRRDSKLLRLIDDFLLITPNKAVAEQFIHTMHAGIASYGVQVKAEKSRANFDMSSNAADPISRLPSVVDFPYCGHTINTVTLDLGKDGERAKKSNIADSVTVEYSKLPGQAFYRKTLHSLQVQMHKMLLSTVHNAVETVISNLFGIFERVAQKTYHYIRSLPAYRQPHEKLVIKAFDGAIRLAQKCLERCRDGNSEAPAVSTAQTRWIACKAFFSVLQPRQTRYSVLLAWLQEQMRSKALRGLEKQLSAVLRTKHVLKSE